MIAKLPSSPLEICSLYGSCVHWRGTYSPSTKTLTHALCLSSSGRMVRPTARQTKAKSGVSVTYWPKIPYNAPISRQFRTPKCLQQVLGRLHDGTTVQKPSFQWSLVANLYGIFFSSSNVSPTHAFVTSRLGICQACRLHLRHWVGRACRHPLLWLDRCGPTQTMGDLPPGFSRDYGAEVEGIITGIHATSPDGG